LKGDLGGFEEREWEWDWECEYERGAVGEEMQRCKNDEGIKGTEKGESNVPMNSNFEMTLDNSFEKNCSVVRSSRTCAIFLVEIMASKD